MIKLTSIFTAVFMLAVLILPISASAQLLNSMPALYNESGDQVNDTSSSLAAGYYYLDDDASADSRVYYFGNGTYFNPNTGLYGGNVSNPSGQAGFVYPSSTVVVPGVPNTGIGGESPVLWLTLALTGLLGVTGMAYLVSVQSSYRNEL